MVKHRKARLVSKNAAADDIAIDLSDKITHATIKPQIDAVSMPGKQRKQATVKTTRKGQGLLEKKQKMINAFRSRLDASQFRSLNEELYTCTGAEAQKLFKQKPDTFRQYHSSYTAQRAQWPCDPLDRIVKWLLGVNTDAESRTSGKPVVADLGCGDARLAANDAVSKRYNVLSFDLIAASDRIIACDMANLPVADAGVDVCVFCLSLMGTNLVDFLVEARRVLRLGSKLLIIEVASRFYNLKKFSRQVSRLGFEAERIAKVHDYFIEMEFTKTSDKGRGDMAPDIQLKPCLYKKR